MPLSFTLSGMSAYDPSPAFHHAAKYLSNAPALTPVSNAIKLELYGLFKFLTVSHSPNTSRPSIFDFTGRAKWDAWNAAGQKYGDRGVDAECRYLDIASGLGWAEDMSLEDFEDQEDDDDDIWDKPSDASNTLKSGEDGIGNVVSTMMHDEDDGSKSRIINLVVDGDVQGVVSYLDGHPDMDVNEVDENGYTPLHLACDRGNAEMVKLLLSRGADMNMKDADELTALELAEISGHDDIVTVLKSTKIKPD